MRKLLLLLAVAAAAVDDSISREDCLAAIRMIQDAVKAAAS